MAKRNFAALALLLVVGAGMQSASAESLSYSVDGCAKLARVVYAEVSNAALNGPGQGGPWYIEQGIGELTQCDHVAKTVSRAFASAMQSAGVSVRFPSTYGAAGDVCLSHYLSQCYPDRDPLMMGYDTPNYGLRGKFTANTWSVVSQSIMRQMHNPYSSDQIRFQEQDLKLRMGLALRSAPREFTHSAKPAARRRR